MSEIGESIKYAYNPLPPVSESEVMEKAGLSRRATDQSPTDWTWITMVGNKRFSFKLKPGEKIPLRGDEVKIFLKEFQERGGVILDNPEDHDEILKATEDGLFAAIEFYQDRGSVRIDYYQERHGSSNEQMERLRNSRLWIYHYNQALADYFVEYLEGLKNGKNGKTVVSNSSRDTKSAKGNDE